MNISQWAIVASIAVAGYSPLSTKAANFGEFVQPVTAVSNSCNDGDVSYDHCCCDPLWTLRAGAVVMNRSTPASQVLVRDANGVPVVNASQLDFDYEWGVDLSARRRIGSIYDIEVRYLGVDSWNASAAGLNSTVAGTIQTNPLTDFGGGPTPVTFDYRSQLYSGEVNVGRWVWDDLRIFAGFRMIELSEDLRGTFLSAINFAYDTNVNNHLYGFQIGAESVLWTNGSRLRVDGVGKVGVFYNNANQNSALTQPPGVPTFGVAAAGADEAAVGLEAGLFGVYQINDHWALRAGYQLLWLDGVALAPDQIANTGDMSAVGAVPAAIDQSDILYHGGLLGLEYTY